MTTQPPAEGFETKNYPGAIPGRPGYQLADQPLPEHGPDGIQYGYSNSPGKEGDDGKSVFDSKDGGSSTSEPETTGTDGATEEGTGESGGTSTSTGGSGTKRTSGTTKSSTSK